MPVYDQRAMPLMEQFKEANAAEGAAITALHDYMKAGGKDNKKLMQLTNEMTAANDKKMQIYQQMKKFRIDEPNT
jgi:hypothetical protein